MSDARPALTRLRLTRILGLPDHATAEQIALTAPRLLSRLRRRLRSATGTEAEGLRKEIADLETSCAHYSALRKAPDRDRSFGRRTTLVAALLGTALMIGLLSLYAAGYRVIREPDAEVAAIEVPPARLVLHGPLPGATLRILDADREEIMLKLPADGASVELAPGRYAIEVRREDCPDRWTRSVYFEAGSLHQFEPDLCAGAGEVTVRSNVSRDRLRIDGLDMGSTGQQPHSLSVGDHEIRVEKKGFLPFVGRVRIEPGKALEIRAELVREGESGSAGTTSGQSLPFAKTPPTNAPTATSAIQPTPFDTSSFRDEIQPPDLGLAGSAELIRSSGLLDSSTGGGSTAWHDRTRASLLAEFDLDHSGAIDRLEESEAIPCSLWKRIEREFDGGGLGLTMARYFGFDGSEWHPNALGFARTHRSAVYEQMKACGLKP